MKFFLLAVLVFVITTSCDKVIVIEPRSSFPVHGRTGKARTPLPVGSIRGYFGDHYRVFTEHIEKVQPIDSFSNVYFYGTCNDALKQINLIRCDSDYVFAIYIMGYPLDSLPADLPVPSEFGKYSEIQFYPFQSWNSTSPGHYFLDDFYGKSVFITDRTNDILTGTFSGTLRSTAGGLLQVSEGEFKIRIFRKFIPCGQ